MNRFLALLLFTTISYSQVGINTDNPTADLEVVASTNLANGIYNGVILPRLSVLPTSGNVDFPTGEQTGLLVYLDSNNEEEGVYVFDGTVYKIITPEFKTVVKAVFSGSNYVSTTGMGNQPNNLVKLPFNATTINRAPANTTAFETSGNDVGEFIAPADGFYRINAQLLSQDYDQSRLHVLTLVRSDNANGDNPVTLAQDRKLHRGGLANNDDNITDEDRVVRTINTIVELNAGQRLELRFSDNFATFAANAAFSWFAIEQL